MAIKLNVIIGGKMFDSSHTVNGRIPDAPNLTVIRKGLHHIFKPIEKEFPGHEIVVLWNEDESKLGYSSDTLHQSTIGDALKRHHGIDL